MEVQSRSFIQAHLANSQFAQKLFEIPILKAAYGTAGDAYVKVKGSNALVGKSIDLALNISSAVVDKLSPIAEKGISVVSPITTKVDEIAAKSLGGLLARIPVINEEPKEIVQNTKSAIEKRVLVISGYTEAALKTWPAQSAMDIYEVILNTANKTLDNVIPASQEEKNSEKDLPAKENLSEEEKHKRGVLLAQRTISMFSTAMHRVFGVYHTQMEKASSVKDMVLKQVRTTEANGNAK